MTPEFALRTCPSRPPERRDERIAWCLWLAAYLFVGAGILAGDNRSVLCYYTEAASNWVRGSGIYAEHAHGFLYLPLAAILSVPFSLLPPLVAEIAWRTLTLGVFAFGFRRFCRLAELGPGARLFLPATCLAIPLCYSSVRNGQATLIMTGSMMLAVDEISRSRWNRAAFFLCLGTALKPLAIVLLLLAGGIHRPLRWRLALGGGGLLLMPYLTQQPQYVTAQYAAFLDVMRTSAQVSLDRPWAQLFWLLRTGGIEVAADVQTLIRLAAAAATLFVASWTHRRLPAARAAQYLFALAGCYLMLFNPRTENNTYALIAPAMGVLCGEAFLVDRKRWLGVASILLGVGTVGSYEIGSRLLPSASPIWLAPLMCVVFLGLLIGRLVREIRRRPEQDWALPDEATLKFPVAAPRRKAA